MSANDKSRTLPQAKTRVADLRRRLEARQGRPVKLIETHVSWLLLTANEAFKLKKPLRLPFLDTSTLAARRAFCEEELRLNRRLAASIYRGIVEVREGPDGADFDATGPVVDVAVRMRRFADGCLWNERLAAGTLTAQQIDAMARRLAEFHRDAAVLPSDSRFGSREVIERITRQVLDAQPADPAGPELTHLRRWLPGELARLDAFWAERRSQGRIRECHGDLHLGNLLQEDGAEPTAFDAIEFDAELRNIDVIDDIAFVVMDLLAQGHSAEAWRFLDAYLEAGGDFEGLPGLRFLMVRRALVRALVGDLSAGVDAQPIPVCTAAGYRGLAAELAAPAAPWLLITHGLPASGKSHVAAELVHRGGAIRLRSDVERKRLFGLTALESSRRVGDIYGEAATRRTYQRLLDLAELLLRAGWPVVVDAAFLRRSERQQFAALAESLGHRFAVVDCRAPQALLRQRIARRLQRADNPSEADLSVLDRLSAVAEPLTPAEAAQSLSIDAADPGGHPAAINRWLSAALPSTESR
ncbi:AAA family ATPase [Piscinibacter sakaiensis]|uniref:bifunctional aminoglycoside phosphotransferase/ATP-binding protein n=1 Tax=Piscinibacter sakaiensis TaxID=1547922 RepID=UPI003AAA9A13